VKKKYIGDYAAQIYFNILSNTMRRFKTINSMLLEVALMIYSIVSHKYELLPFETCNTLSFYKRENFIRQTQKEYTLL
jgi:hypothetical protein